MASVTIYFYHNSELYNHLLKETCIMGDGAMFAKKSTIDINHHGEMVKLCDD